MDNTGEKKKEILEMLAKKLISKEEAERKLEELGEPMPATEPAKPAKKSNKGCLIAIIIVVVLLPVLLVIFFVLALLLWRSDEVMESHPVRVESVKEIEDKKIERK